MTVLPMWLSSQFRPTCGSFAAARTAVAGTAFDNGDGGGLRDGGGRPGIGRA